MDNLVHTGVNLAQVGASVVVDKLVYAGLATLGVAGPVGLLIATGASIGFWYCSEGVFTKVEEWIRDDLPELAKESWDSIRQSEPIESIELAADNFLKGLKESLVGVTEFAKELTVIV